MASSRLRPVNERQPALAEVLEKRISMLAHMTPAEYGQIENTQEALAASAPPVRDVTLRLKIVWDNELDSLDLEAVLGKMRETGAAMVVSVEQVS